MPNIYLSRLIALSVLVFFLIFLPGWFFIDYIERIAIGYTMEKCLQMAGSLWNSVVSTNQKAVEVYFEYRISTGDIPKLLELAKEDPVSARTLIYKRIWEDYDRLTKELKVRNIIFLLPDGKVLLRMRTPNVHDDVMRYTSNSGSVSGFGTDGMLSGWLYSFPIVKNSGEHLGTVVITVPLEHLRRILQNLNRQAFYIFLFSEDVVNHMVLPEYRKYYGSLEGLNGWFIEDPYRKLHDSSPSLSAHEKAILRDLFRSKDFRKHIYSPEDSYMILKSGGRYYKVMFVKLKGSNGPLAVLVSVVLGKDIENLVKGHNVYQLGVLLLALTLSAYTFFYLRNVYHLRLEYEEINAIVSLMGAGLVVLNRDGRVKLVNDHAASLLGYKKEELINNSLHELIHYHTGPKESCPVYLAVIRGLDYSGDDSFKKKDGTLLDVHLDLRTILLGGHFVGSVLVFYDISERKQKEKELYIRATQDQLTRLYNRWFAEDILSKLANQAERSKKSMSIVLYDLDDFKKINDTYGHQVGDTILQRVSEIIRNNVRIYDIPVRWGGEEFMVIMPETDESEAYRVAERIRKLIEKEKIENLWITVSGGVATYRAGENIESFISRADRGLYEAKRRGKNRIVIVMDNEG